MSEPGDVDADEASEIERIKEQKRQRLLGQGRDESRKAAGTGTGRETGTNGKETGTNSEGTTPGEPIYADGRAELRQFVGEHEIVLADFYADWCGPCKMLDPIVEVIADRTPAAVLKVDIDRHVALAREYGVQSVPTLVLFVDGQPVKRLLGVQDEGTLRDLIEKYAD